MDSNRWRGEIEKFSDRELINMILAFKMLKWWKPYCAEYGGVSGILNYLEKDRERRLTQKKRKNSEG